MVGGPLVGQLRITDTGSGGWVPISGGSTRRDKRGMTERAIPDPPFHVPEAAWRDTLRPIQDAGARGYECFVLWFGQVKHRRMHVTAAIVPRQSSKHVDEGCYVHVEGSELFRLSVLAHARKELICAQVHAHPYDAYHSEVDERLPLVSLPGALSVVLPYFAAPSHSEDGWAIFQLQESGKWRALREEEALIVGPA